MPGVVFELLEHAENFQIPIYFHISFYNASFALCETYFVKPKGIYPVKTRKSPENPDFFKKTTRVCR